MDNPVSIKDDIVIGRAGDRDLKGDLFLPPESKANSKAVVIIHGGGWREGSKEQLRGYGILLSREGFVCLCTEYRLSQEEKWPAQIQDIKCAIRYLRANSSDLNINPSCIGVSGNSAGGHLSLMAGLHCYDNSFNGDGGNSHVTSEVKAICAIYPPTEIRKFENTEPIFDAYKALMGDNAKEFAYENASPLLKIENNFPPTMLIHGSSDSVVKLSDSTNFYQKLKELNVPAELHIFSEEEHAFDSQNRYGRSVADLQYLFFTKYL